MFSYDVLLNECPEDRQVPEVDNEEPSTTGHEERKGQDTNIEEALIVHPSNDEDPDEEGDNVQESISAVLHRVKSCASYDVENSGLVEDCIDFCDKTENCKAHSLLSDESPSKANDDQKVMKQEHARPAVGEHVHSLCHVNTQGENDQMLGRERGCEHEVSCQAWGVVENHHSPGTCYSCTQSGNESRPPLPPPGTAVYHRRWSEGQEKEAGNKVECRAQEQPGEEGRHLEAKLEQENPSGEGVGGGVHDICVDAVVADNADVRLQSGGDSSIVHGEVERWRQA
eukprot:GFUD01030450.1.p2 GENE.GFUD01030450.1~~GFUD01030450.1.p2  ORF type:complete len:284 (+),score=106.86 GFUD01030450.1:176-1027(+)